MADHTKYTSKPCPACKEKPQWRRKADDICDECRKLIEAGQSLVESKGAARTMYALPFAAHGLPYFRHDDEFQEAFYAVLVAAGPVAKTSGKRLAIKDYEIGLDQSSVKMSAALADALADVYNAAMHAVALSYEDGRKDGEDVIRGLAAGRTSLQELNRLSINGR